jgi:alpha-ketoglutarate-dependent taurine dioxygenase
MTFAAAAPAGTALSPFGVLVEPPAGTVLPDFPPAALAGLAEEHAVVVLRGVPLLPKADLVRYCEGWGDILYWDFGAVLDLRVEEAPRNYLFTRGPVPYHWDGAFAAATPRYFIFQCMQAPAAGNGGETVFCDTRLVWATASTAQRERWHRTSMAYTTEKLAHYGGKVTWPLVSAHPKTGEPVLRYAEPLPPEKFASPLSVDVVGLPPAEQGGFLAELHELLYRPEFCYVHQWCDGDIVIADNHALLHGRNRFMGDSSRWLQRIQVI